MDKLTAFTVASSYIKYGENRTRHDYTDEELIETLSEALIPPTANEVCILIKEDLLKYVENFYGHVSYNKRTKSFDWLRMNTRTPLITYEHNVISTILFNYTPTTMKMVSMFYESESEGVK